MPATHRSRRPLATFVGGAIVVASLGAASSAATVAAEPGAAAALAGGRDDHVDLTVALDRGGPRARGAKVFRVDHQPIEDSDGELNRDDLVRNPSGYCGDVPVDVDPVRRTITVGHADRACSFGHVRVVLRSRVIDRVRLVRDGLFRTHAKDYETSVRSTRRGVELRWVRVDRDGPSPTSGTSTFRYRAG